MSRNILTLTLGLAVLMGSNAQSQQSNSVNSLSQIASNKTINAKAAAMALLPRQALAKTDPETLNQLLDNESNDVIVMFEDAMPHVRQINSTLTQHLAAQKNAYAIERKNFMSDMNTSEMTYINEYSHLPAAFVRLKSNVALIKLLKHPRVIGIARNVKMISHGIDAESGPLIHQPGAPAAGITGAGTTVAIIDNGLIYNHPDFGSCTAANTPQSCRVVATESFTTGVPFTSTIGPAPVLAGKHGSNVAGIAAGIAPQTKIAALDVFGGTGTTNAAKVAIALDWVIANKVRLNIVSVNLSLGIPDSTCIGTTTGEEGMYAMAIQKVRNANVLPIASSGNEASTTRVSVPACVPGAIAVGSLMDGVYPDQISYKPQSDPTLPQEVLCTTPQSLTGPYVVSCFSNSSPRLTMFAPGHWISAAGILLRGTSQAAPHVAGAVALLRSSAVAPNESLAQIEARLTRPGWTVTDKRNSTSLTRPRLTVMGAIANGHFNVTQQIYVAFFGRPADVGGMIYWANELGRGAAPTTLSALASAYNTNSAVRTMLLSFGTSAESARLYPGTTATYVTAVYKNLFNRTPDVAGLNYWVAEIDSGRVARAQAAVIILLGAQNSPFSDFTTANQKVAFANQFTTSIDRTGENAKYSGSNDVALGRGRSTLQLVNSTTPTSNFQPIINQNLSLIEQGL